VAEDIYSELMNKNIETLIDDRKASVGVKFKDSDLLGIPLKVIIGKTYDNEGLIEIENRSGEKIKVEVEKVVETIIDIINEETEKFYK
jgi:prolyl-tRNA synthetase